MAKVAESKTNNTLKGTYKPPRFIAFGLDNGVAFRRAYRTFKGAKKLENKAGVSHLTIVSAH